MEKIKLKDETILMVENGVTEECICVVVNNLSDMIPYAEALTKENLSKCEVLNEENVTTAIIKNKRVNSGTFIPIGNGTYKIIFYLENVEYDIAALLEEIESLKQTQEIQDGAIQELAETIAEV